MGATRNHFKLGIFGVLLLFATITPILGVNLIAVTQSVPCNEDQEITSSDTMSLYAASINGTHVQVLINNTGLFWGRCMNITIIQLTTTDLTVLVQIGDTLIPTDGSIQTMIVASNATLSTSGQDENDTASVFAFCGESQDSAPDADTIFTVGGTPYSPTSCVGKILAYFEIDDMYRDSMYGQMAIWACIDGTTGYELLDPATKAIINSILSAAGTGLQIGEGGFVIPGFEIFPILGALLFLIALSLVISKRTKDQYKNIL